MNRAGGQQLYAVHWTGGQAQLAAGAQRFYHHVHVFGAADDGVHGTRLDAFGAADAIGFDDQRDGRRFVQSARPVIGLGRRRQNMRERSRTRIAAGWATVYARFMQGHGFGIGTAAVEAALPALGLRQEAVETVGKGKVHDVRIRIRIRNQRTGIPGSAVSSASSNAKAPPSKPADRIMPSLVPKRILRGARLAMNTTLRPTSFPGSP